MPNKKPKNKELTKEQKEDNVVVSSIRVTIEHFLARLKSFFITANRYRNRLY